ncbi:transcription factor tfiiic complex subunit sfc9 [Schizosaccharomyces cryophilus OY26]|uniref:Transcription factor tfiiic complex subunit sfc9 n=1 Tax=Schizosaccharomyces cryophilus (strain OY26 / ATCC MYA-4695 / CBS 11777 / NBRC 106824 / NRRL Y48691) TaxID=653667 RepID=S9WX08_SCHCR|nr:transcription factor tfiiic complex subunit sfc9 [Schizosaccharomyces cryophilus OY26]EPY49272.1 transcription factor tfiiic complex subunit sfc9 [Schizosaccharomyces cryophilus OY26]
MPKDVSLDFLPSSFPSCEWSPDGKLAFCNGGRVQILTPSHEINTPSYIKSLAILENYDENERMYSPTDLRIGDLISNHTARKVAWSPTGLSENYGCLLTVLTNRYQVYLYSSNSKVLHMNWKCVCCLNNYLSRESLASLRIHTFAWSPLLSLPKLSPWGICLLGLGAEDGNLHVISLSRNSDMLTKSIKLECGWLVRLSFSSWTIYNHAAVCNLVCISQNGEIYVVRVSVNLLTGSFEMRHQRFPFQVGHRPIAPAIAWSPVLNDEEFLALAYPRSLYISCYSRSNEKFLSITSHDLTSLASPVGVFFASNDISQFSVYILTPLAELQIVPVKMDPSNTFELPEKQLLDRFLTHRLQNYGSTSEPSKSLRIHAFCPSPFSSTAIIHFSVSYPQSFIYTASAMERSFCATFPSIALKATFSRLINSFLTNCCSIPAEGCFCEFALLENSSKADFDVNNMLSESLSQLLISDFDFCLRLKDTAPFSTLTSVFFDASLNALRLLYGWSVYSQKSLNLSIFSSLRNRLVLSLMVFALNKVSSNNNYLTATCKAILKNCVSFIYKELSEVPAVLEIADQIAKYIDVPSAFQELCPACKDHIEFTNEAIATCSKGHVWQRCSITMLLLYQRTARYCGICKSVTVDWASLNVESTCFTKEIQEELSICYFCGGHYLS